MVFLWFSYGFPMVFQYESLFFWTATQPRSRGSPRSPFSSFQLAIRDPIINGLAVREGHFLRGSDLGSDENEESLWISGAFYVGLLDGLLGVAGMMKE